MQPDVQYDRFSFLTPSRIHAIGSGVRSFNSGEQKIIQDSPHLLQHMSAQLRAQAQRPWLLAQITEALSYDDHIKRCEYGTVQGILFDEAYFCRLFKLYETLDESCVGGPRIGREPVIVRKARELPYPRMLLPPDEFDDGFVPPLSHLCVYDIGYLMRRRQVVELYFLFQDGFRVHAMRPLSMPDDRFPQSGQDSA